LNKYRLLLLTIFIISFSGCTYKNKQIADISNYSQNPKEYTQNLNEKLINQEKLSENFLKRYFSPWTQNKLTITKEDAQWGNIYKSRKVYLENYTLASKQWFEKLSLNSNFEKFNTTLQKAIVIKNSNVRVFPTISKLFYNPKQAGEGFPFDYNQNSNIKINTPVLISHYSKDKAWAYIQSHFVSGWLRMDSLAFVDEKFINSFNSKNFVVSVKEDFPLFDKSSFIETIKISTLFPLIDNKVFVAKKALDSKAILTKVDFDENYFSKFPLEFSENNLEKVSNEFLGELYGWGGLLNHRDCSSFTQDYFTLFGLYLNRNSKAQRSGFRYENIAKLSDENKKSYIIKNGVPFLTLIYLRGHIMLYIGHKDNEPLVMHNMWGVRTWRNLFEQGRNIVGKTVISTLEPGIELENVNLSKTILKKVQGLVFLNEKSK